MGDHSCECSEEDVGVPADTKEGNWKENRNYKKRDTKRQWMETCFTIRCLKKKKVAKLFICRRGKSGPHEEKQ